MRRGRTPRCWARWQSWCCRRSSTAARTAGLPQGVVLMDAGYGNDTRRRTEITALGMSYVAGIGPNTSVWPPAAAPLPPQTRLGCGRPQTRLQRDEEHQPVTESVCRELTGACG